MGSIPVGDSDFPLSHARAMLINSPVTFTFFNFVGSKSISTFSIFDRACGIFCLLLISSSVDALLSWLTIT